jgi:hypothetical protein
MYNGIHYKTKMARIWKGWPAKSDAYGRWIKRRDSAFDFLSEHHGHLSPKKIYQALSALHPQIGLATIYRTLKLLIRLKFLNRLPAQDGQNRYEFKGPLATAFLGKNIDCFSTGYYLGQYTIPNRWDGHGVSDSDIVYHDGLYHMFSKEAF